MKTVIYTTKLKRLATLAHKIQSLGRFGDFLAKKQHTTLSWELSVSAMHPINDTTLITFTFTFEGVVEFGPEVTGKDQTTKMLLNDQDKVKRETILQ